MGKFNTNIENLQPSKTVTLMSKIQEMQKTDDSLLNFTAGEPDFATPMKVCDEAYRQLKAGYTHYTPAAGLKELREAIAQKLQSENGAPFTADQILVTPGGKFAVYLAIQAILNPGDEAIWLTPGWVSYPSIIESGGGVPVAVHLKWDEGYAITEEALESAVSDRTKLLIINYPNNPTGKTLSPADREAVAAFMRRHPDVWLLSDEIYETIVYPGFEAVSMASCPDLAERVIIVNGFSKSSAMTGWRIGYLACCSELCRIVMKLFQHTMSCTSGFVQKAALVSMSCREEMEEMRLAYERRAKILYEGIKDLPHVGMQRPEGAFYAWVKFDLGMDEDTICSRLLDEAKIAGVPGYAYGEEEKTCVRFSFAASEEDIKEMLVRLEGWLKTVG